MIIKKKHPQGCFSFLASPIRGGVCEADGRVEKAFPEVKVAFA